MLFALFGKNISVQNTYKNKADTTNSNYLDQLDNCREKTSCNTKVCSFLSLLCPSAGATLCVVKMSPSPTFHSRWRERVAFFLCVLIEECAASVHKVCGQSLPRSGGERGQMMQLILTMAEYPFWLALLSPVLSLWILLYEKLMTPIAASSSK